MSNTRVSKELLHHSTDFTLELIAEFDSQRKKMHEEIEAQRRALRDNTFEEPSQEIPCTNPTLDTKPETTEEIQPTKVNRTVIKFKQLRKSLVHFWKQHTSKTDVASTPVKVTELKRGKTLSKDMLSVRNDKPSAKFHSLRVAPFLNSSKETQSVASLKS
ncbi:hypothetical protein K7432_010197 [Basidiobolus ranarum]|uniref:Uncharacterized protein n=1 Tax=Basidiobolus ranarum TaxID=34480 RepID=A0ABR2WP21_9FUNG